MIIPMSLAAIQKELWYQAMPELLQKVVDSIPCNRYYILDGRKCFIVKYEAVPLSGKLEDCKVSVNVPSADPLFAFKEGVVWTKLKGHNDD